VRRSLGRGLRAARVRVPGRRRRRPRCPARPPRPGAHRPPPGRDPVAISAPGLRGGIRAPPGGASADRAAGPLVAAAHSKGPGARPSADHHDARVGRQCGRGCAAANGDAMVSANHGSDTTPGSTRKRPARRAGHPAPARPLSPGARAGRAAGGPRGAPAATRSRSGRDISPRITRRDSGAARGRIGRPSRRSARRRRSLEGARSTAERGSPRREGRPTVRSGVRSRERRCNGVR